MAKLKIYAFPDVVLTQKAAPIGRVDQQYRKIADDLLETMYDAPGIGLAANQVGLLERIVVVDTEYDLEELPGGGEVLKNKRPKILINPEIIFREGKASIEEGCLSVPEYTAEVLRAEKIKLTYLDIDGLSHTISADGLQAICIQHELDHLDGKLFIDRLSFLKKDLAQKKLLKDRKARESDLRLGSRRRLDAMSAKKREK